MEKQRPPLTFQQIKDFVNNLSPEQLEMEARWWGDERGGVIRFLDTIGEEMVLTDEGYAPITCFTEGEMKEYDLEEAPRLPANTPIFSVD